MALLLMEANAQRCREKHERWSKDYWLGQFRDRGLIRWDEGGDVLKVLRDPEPYEIKAAEPPSHVLYS